MNPTPPMPPARRQRRPFITTFLGEVFPFLSGRDLLVCALVSRQWQAEADAISLWRNLLLTDPVMRAYAYLGLPLRVMKKVVLKGMLYISLRQPNQEDRTFSPQIALTRQSETTLENEEVSSSQGHLERNFSIQTFSSQIPLANSVRPIMSRSNLTEITSETTSKTIESLLKAVETIQRRTLRIKGGITTSGDRIKILFQQLPSMELLRFHQECLKGWTELKGFEELTVTLFCSSIDDVTLRGIFRSFAHIEMANLRNVGSSTHLQWCRFKKNLPLDENYYDYMDCLYSLGPGKQNDLKITPQEEFEGRERLHKYQALRKTIQGIINYSNDNERKFGWNDLLEQLEIK